jgi:hypothetical protein
VSVVYTSWCVLWVGISRTAHHTPQTIHLSRSEALLVPTPQQTMQSQWMQLSSSAADFAAGRVDEKLITVPHVGLVDGLALHLSGPADDVRHTWKLLKASVEDVVTHARCAPDTPPVARTQVLVPTHALEPPSFCSDCGHQTGQPSLLARTIERW